MAILPGQIERIESTRSLIFSISRRRQLAVRLKGANYQ